VVLHEPSAQWSVNAADWIRRVRSALGDLRPRVEHVGSNAVPGLVAKPTIDLQVSVPDLDDEPSYRPALESLGVVLRAREPGHRYFRPDAGKPRVVHIHVCGQGSTWEHEHLLFRDFLRSHRAVATDYAELKRRLAVEFRHDRLAYTDGKTEFVRQVVAMARQEAESG